MKAGHRGQQESVRTWKNCIIFLTLFPKNYILWQQTNMSRSCDPYSHIKKRKNITIFWIARNNKQESTSFSLVLHTFYLPCENWNFFEQQIKEYTVGKKFSFGKHVLKTQTHCVRVKNFIMSAFVISLARFALQPVFNARCYSRDYSRVMNELHVTVC